MHMAHVNERKCCAVVEFLHQQILKACTILSVSKGKERKETIRWDAINPHALSALVVTIMLMY